MRYVLKSLIYTIPNTWFLLPRQQKIKTWWFLKEISDYFTKLVEPLVITQRLEERFDKFNEEIIERFEEKFTVSNQEIVSLEEKIALQEKKTEYLRYCFRMYGLKY